MQAHNNIVPFQRQVIMKKSKCKDVPEYKLQLLEHVMLFQFDGPDDFYHAIDVLIERWSDDDD
jgi:hypothetical protein